MNSPLSFLGKCFTVLVGIALSWATVTNSDVASLASGLLGEGTVDSGLSLATVAVSPQTSTPAETDPVRNLDRSGMASLLSGSAETELALAERQPNETSDQRIQEISAMLKRLGASYLLLEKLPQTNGNQYRVRCDLADQEASVKCCFEATRDTPLDAMEEVLRAAQRNSATRASRQALSASI